MRIVGIVAQDWANAAWNVFQALKKYGVDAYLINTHQRRCQIQGYEAYYDVPAWNVDGARMARTLIETADVYHIFESGGTTSFLPQMGLKKDTPRILSINSSGYARGSREDAIIRFNRDLKPHADLFTALTFNIKVPEAEWGLQPLNSEEYTIRTDYSLRNKVLTVGSAPGYEHSYKKKKYPLLNSIIPNFDVIMHSTQAQLKKRMQEKHDFFCNGIGAGGIGYSSLQAAMFGLPCMAYVYDEYREDPRLHIEGHLPVLETGDQGQFIPDLLKMMEDEDTRRHYGQLCARWARKHQSYKACSDTYKGFYKRLLGE